MSDIIADLNARIAEIEAQWNGLDQKPAMMIRELRSVRDDLLKDEHGCCGKPHVVCVDCINEHGVLVDRYDVAHCSKTAEPCPYLFVGSHFLNPFTGEVRHMSTVPSIKADPRQMQFKTILEGEQFQRALCAVLPRHIRGDRMIRVVLAAMQNNQEILKCTPESILLSIMRAASMGLEPDGGPLGQGYLVPFWNSKKRCKECQFIPGYRGLIKMARNSGEIADVSADVAYEADFFEYSMGLDPTLEHRRNDQVADPGPLKYAYAIARFRDGNKKFVVMNQREIEEIKEVSASRDREGNLIGPWCDWEAEMWKKTVVRRLCKQLPLAVELQTVIQSEPMDTSQLISLPSLPDVSGMIPHEASPEETPAGGESLEDLFAKFSTEFAAADGIIAKREVRDGWFGQNSTIEFTPELARKADDMLHEAERDIRQSRGPRSNKTQGKLMDTNESAQQAGV